MTPTRPDEDRLYKLFVRYWDNTLAPDEAGELASRLAADPAARGLFELFTLQAVAAGELRAVAVPSASDPVTPPPDETPESPPPTTAPTGPAVTKAAWTRRRALQYFGGGLAAGVGGIALGWRLWPESPDRRPRLVAARGAVTVHTPGGVAAAPAGRLPEQAVVTTRGTGSSVVIAYEDGSSVSLLGDTVVAADEGGLRLRLQRGAAAADVRVRPEGTPALSLATAQVLLPALSGALVTLGQQATATDVEVQRGQVSATDPGGGPLAVVRAGEFLTVRAGGDVRKQKISATPDSFSLDLTRPLPDGWAVGAREETADGPVLRLESWPDPYYEYTRMYQARSDQPWTRGMFRLTPDSRVRVRYRATASGPGQVCFCVRTGSSRRPDTGMLDYNGGFEKTAPGQWGLIDVTAGSMLAPPNKHAPKFDAPWIGFLVIFNTYEQDLGLQIAEFRVTPPEAAQ